MAQNIYILGLDHKIQVFDGECTAEKKLEFGELLRRLMSERQFEFIGEESFLEKCTIARSVAGLLGIRWELIEMSREARKALGIADEQYHQRQPFDDIQQKPSEESRVPSDGIREEYMVWRTLQGAANAKNVLVLCGMLHVEELRRRFERAGSMVTVDSLRNYDWYRNTDCKHQSS